MSVEIVIDCDATSHAGYRGIEEGGSVYCEVCYEELVDQLHDAEQHISELEAELAKLKEEAND